MSTKGNAESFVEMRGSLKIPDMITGKSAYEIAVMCGYEGTEKEWLESLEGESAYKIAVRNGFQGTEKEWVDSLPGKSAYEIALKHGFQGTEEEWLESLKAEDGAKGRIGYATLTASGWNGENHLHSQVVTIDGVTPNTKVDLTPSVEQLVIFYEKDITFVTENEGGVVTVYAIGQKPQNDYTIQVTMTEVMV